jgi:hypothetical protein
MIETYRMLGREHEADLEREAHRRALARVAAPRPRRFHVGAIASAFASRWRKTFGIELRQEEVEQG